MKNKKYLKLIGNILLVVIILGIIIFVMRHSMAEIFEGLKNTDMKIVFAVVLLGVGYQIAEGINISQITYSFQPAFTWLNGFFCSCYVAFYRVISFGSATSISEVLYYRHKNIETSEGIGIAALHMVFYKLALIIFALLGLILNLKTILEYAPILIPFVILGVVVTTGIISFILILSANEKLHNWLISKLLKLKWLQAEKWQSRINSASQQIFSLQHAVRKIMRDKTMLFKLIFLNLFKLLFWLCIPYIILAPTHDISFSLTFSMTAFSVILSGVIPTPAGIGSFEFVYLMLFKPFIGTAGAGSSVLLYRFATYVLPFLIGMIYVGVTKKKQMDLEIHELKEERREG